MTQINTDKLITLKKSVIIGFIVSIIFGVIGIVFGFLGNLYIGDGHDNIFTVIAIPFFVIPMVTFVMIGKSLLVESTISVITVLLMVIIFQGLIGAFIGNLVWRVRTKSHELSIWLFALTIAVILIILGLVSFILMR